MSCIFIDVNISKLYLVDPYLPYTNGDGRQQQPGIHMQEAKKRLDQFSDRITWILKPSLEAASEIPDNLDFVYIDGLHTYSMVKTEIKLYSKKLKPGGIIGGHNFEAYYPGIAKAVIEFIEASGLQLHAAVGYSDWWVVIE